MPRRRRAFAAAAAITLAGALLLSGCAPGPWGYACPAIGYLQTFTVRLSGPGAATAAVELCDGGSCTSPTPSSADPPLVLVTPDATAPSVPPASTLTGLQLRHSGDKWEFIGTFPARFEVRAVTAAGAVLVREEVSPAWRRTGGDARCGGPGAASVDLVVPAG